MATINALNNKSSPFTVTAGDLTVSAGQGIITDISAATTSPIVYFKKYRAAAALTSGDLIGTLKFGGYDGTQVTDGARITSTSSGTIASTRVAGDLKFYTHPDSAAADPTLRMTIGPAGNITIAAPDAGTALTITAGGLTVTAGNIAASSGTLSASTTVTAGTNLVSTAGNLLLPTTSSTVGQIQINGSTYLHTFGSTTLKSNVFVGFECGNFSMTNDTANTNCAIGYQCLSHLTTGSENCGFGDNACHATTTGTNNLGFGHNAVKDVETGGFNTGIGVGAGSSWTLADSYNIALGISYGTAGETNVMRLGNDASYGVATTTKTYIAGIYNTAVGATAGVVLSDSAHQLGGLAGAAGTVLVGGTKPSFSSAVVLAAGGSLDTSTSAGNTLLIRAYDVDGTTYKTFATLTANNTPTMDLDTDVTIASNYIYRATGTDVPVTDGGTGASTLTDHGILLGSGSGAITPLGEASNGQLPIGSSGADPVLAALTAGTGISVTNGAGSISIAATGTILAWSEITDATKTIVVQEAYVANRGTQIVFTLPATAALGTEFKIQGLGAGLIKVEQAAGQIIHLGSAATTTGVTGYVEATNRYDSISLVCVVADLEFCTTSVVGNITVA